jgi:hypothetical protein
MRGDPYELNLAFALVYTTQKEDELIGPRPTQSFLKCKSTSVEPYVSQWYTPPRIEIVTREISKQVQTKSSQSYIGLRNSSCSREITLG